MNVHTILEKGKTKLMVLFVVDRLLRVKEQAYVLQRGGQRRDGKIHIRLESCALRREHKTGRAIQN